MIPVAPHSQAAKLLPLDVDEVARRLRRPLPQLHRVDPMAVDVEAADGGDLRGQPVVVPPRNVGAVEAPHRLVLDHHILQHFVQRLAEMDIAVREGGAIVQDVLGASLSLLLNGPIEVDLLPELLYARLHLAQVRPHRKIGLRQVQRLLILARLRHHTSSST